MSDHGGGGGGGTVRHRTLRAWRKAQGYTQEEAVAAAVAAGVAVTQEEWSRWERGIRRPSVEAARVLSELTGVARTRLLRVSGDRIAISDLGPFT